MSGTRFEIDQTLCQGHTRCAALLPDIFDLDDDGFASVYAEGPIPDALTDIAEDVVASCPEGAISLQPLDE